MIPIFEWYFYPEFAAKGIIKKPKIENIQFKGLKEIKESVES